MQDKCIHLCLTLNKMHHISEEDFKTNVVVFKLCQQYMSLLIKEALNVLHEAE